MNTNDHLTVGDHVLGLNVAARGPATSSAAGTQLPGPSSTATATDACPPSVHSLAVNVDLHLTSQLSGLFHCLSSG